MKHRRTQTIALAAVILGSLSGAHAAQSDDAKIRAVLENYEQALNASDTAGVAELYTEDGVFMAQHRPSAVGIDAVKATYEAAFHAIDLNVKFDIVEIQILAGGWAFARTNSTGTTTIIATGDQIPEANQELFVLKKTDGGNWKIARYSFSTTNPRQ